MVVLRGGDDGLMGGVVAISERECERLRVERRRQVGQGRRWERPRARGRSWALGCGERGSGPGIWAMRGKRGEEGWA